MKTVKCKQCGCDIFHDYERSLIKSLNIKDKNEKHMALLQQHPTEDCNTSIYLTCENNHINKYFCKIQNK